MEVITACENICRDFAWLPVAAQVLGGLAAFGTMLVAWVAYVNWRRPKVADRALAIAADLLGELREFENTLLAARVCLQWPHEFDYVEAKRLLDESSRIRTQLQSKAELIGALLRREDVGKAVGDLSYVLYAIERNLRRAQEYTARGELDKAQSHRLLFIGEEIMGDDALEATRQSDAAAVEKVAEDIRRLRDLLAQLVRMEG